MTRLGVRLCRLEQAHAANDVPLIVVSHTLAEDGSALTARVVTHDGAPTADAIAARERLTAEGFTVAPGWGY